MRSHRPEKRAQVKGHLGRHHRYNKRKCVEIASNLAYRMAQSGAYADLDDNEFAAYAIKVAAHLVDNDYSHNEQEGPPAGTLGQ